MAQWIDFRALNILKNLKINLIKVFKSNQVK